LTISDSSGEELSTDIDCALCVEPRDVKEDAIVAAARETFLSKGFDAASMDEIALLANVSKRTVYNRFQSKEALFAAAILETCRQVLPSEFEQLEADLPPYELLSTLARKFVYGVFSPETIALRRIAAFEAQRTPALGRAYLDNGPRLMVKACIPIIERMAARTDLEIEDPERALWQLGALLTEPLYTLVMMGQPPDNLDQEIDDQIQSGLAAFLKLHQSD